MWDSRREIEQREVDNKPERPLMKVKEKKNYLWSPSWTLLIIFFNKWKAPTVSSASKAVTVSYGRGVAELLD